MKTILVIDGTNEERNLIKNIYNKLYYYIIFIDLIFYKNLNTLINEMNPFLIICESESKCLNYEGNIILFKNLI